MTEKEKMLSGQLYNHTDPILTNERNKASELVNKAVSLSYLANSLHIKTDEVIAVGDSYNDISMIKQAGLGVAMANGIDEIKNIADYITKSNMDDGIVEVIHRFLLGKKKIKEKQVESIPC